MADDVDDLFYFHPSKDYIVGKAGWTLDCSSKKDFDPIIVRISSRTYADGSYGCSVYLGEDYQLENNADYRHHNDTKVRTQDEACAIVESWSKDQARKIHNAIKALYSNERKAVDPYLKHQVFKALVNPGTSAEQYKALIQLMWKTFVQDEMPNGS